MTRESAQADQSAAQKQCRLAVFRNWPVPRFVRSSGADLSDCCLDGGPAHHPRAHAPKAIIELVDVAQCDLKCSVAGSDRYRSVPGQLTPLGQTAHPLTANGYAVNCGACKRIAEIQCGRDG